MRNTPHATLAAALGLAGILAESGCKERPRKATTPFSAENLVLSETADPDYVHPDYRFKIGGLDNKWKVLPPGEIESVVPDACAGAMRVGGAHGAVIVEPVGEVDPGDYLELLLSSIDGMFPGMEVHSVEDITHHDRQAKQAEYAAVVSGIPVHYRSVVFIHQGHGYQVLAWYPTQGDGKPAMLQEFIDAVEIVDGEVTAPPALTIDDFDGVGRRVRAGRFESPVYRLAAQAPDGWALMSELELRQTNDSAELGMMHAGTGCYLTVVPERGVSASPDDYCAQVRADLDQGYTQMGGVAEGDPVRFVLAGEDLEFRTRRIDTILPTRMYDAVFVRDGIVYQVQAWHFEQEEGDLVDVLAPAVGALEFLDQSEAKGIEDELAALPDPQRAVGPEFSLRNGTYRNFASQVVWQKPAGMWRISTGDEAALINPSLAMQAQSLVTGIYVQLISEPGSGWDAEEFHQLVLRNYSESEGYENLTPRPDVFLDGEACKSVSFRQAARGDAAEFRVVTTVRGGQAHQILVFGIAEHMQAASALVDEAVHSFKFPGDTLQEVESGANWYRDHRTGFEVRVPGSGWRMQENVQAVFQPIGNSVQFLRSNGMVLLIGFHLHDNRNVDKTTNALIQDVLKVNLDRSSRQGVTESKIKIAGQEARLLEVASGGEHVRAASFSKRGTVFLMMAAANSRSEADKLFSGVRTTLKLLP